MGGSMDKADVPRKVSGETREIAGYIAKSLKVNPSAYHWQIEAIAEEIVAQGGNDAIKASMRVCNRIEDLLGEMDISEPGRLSNRRLEAKTTLAEFAKRREGNVSELLAGIIGDKGTLREFVRNPEGFAFRKKKEKGDEPKLAKIDRS